MDWADNGGIENEKLKEIPLCEFIVFGAYSFMLLIEKIVFSAQSLIPMLNEGGGHGHGHGHDDDVKMLTDDKKSPILPEDDEDSDEDEEAFKNVVSAKGKFASFLQIRNCNIKLIT